jgi:uncharacterized membrane protein YphA (DoxX/SURF4 family)
MTAAVWTGRVVLALVFAVSGGAKLADQEGARRTVRSFAVPAPLVPAAGFGVAVLELVLALGLILPATARAAATASAVLLGVFLIGLGTQLQRGLAIPCACFGRLSSAPVTWRTLVRNAALAAVAIFLLSQLP